MKKRISVFFCMLIGLCSNAQTAGYHYTAPIDSVNVSGFYRIQITPPINAHLKTDFSDLRIIDSSGKWVPHVVDERYKETKGFGFAFPFRILSLTSSGTTSELTLSKPGMFPEYIGYIELSIRNTAAERWCKISGSDNNKNWYVVQDSVLLQPSAGDSGKAVYGISFPSCNYTFFRLHIINGKNDPVNILAANTREMLYYYPFTSVQANPLATFEQMDSGKVSYIKVTQPKAYHFDNINFRIKGAKYFYRKVSLFIPDDTSATIQHPGVTLQTLFLSNNNLLEFNTAVSNAKVFYIQIYNEDNPSLKVDSVGTNSHIRFIEAYLDSGAHYTLLMGNNAATAPHYDLAHVKLDSIKSLGDIYTGAVKEINVGQNDTAKKSNANKIILWTAIIGILLLLLFFTMKMLKEINKNKSDVHL